MAEFKKYKMSVSVTSEGLVVTKRTATVIMSPPRVRSVEELVHYDLVAVQIVRDIEVGEKVSVDYWGHYIE